MASSSIPLPRGIVSVLQTPFDASGAVDEDSLVRLVEDAIGAGAVGFLVPAVASEVDTLSPVERERIVARACRTVRGRVPIVAGASAADPADCIRHARVGERAGATAMLVAVPDALYSEPAGLIPFFRAIADGCGLPLVVQDLQFNGPGLDLAAIHRLADAVTAIRGFKVETVPAGPKYTAVRESLGPDVWIAGGWAVQQMIEALDRGVDAMVPESSMVRVYAAIVRAYDRGDRARAAAIFRKLLPVLAYTNQELLTSIAFFKRLLVRRGIFATDRTRKAGFAWDAFNARIAEELVDLYLALDAEVTAEPEAGG